MSNRDLEKLARAERNAYLREWRAKNPEKVKAQRDRYWIRRAERILAEREAQDGER